MPTARLRRIHHASNEEAERPDGAKEQVRELMRLGQRYLLQVCPALDSCRRSIETGYDVSVSIEETAQDCDIIVK